MQSSHRKKLLQSRIHKSTTYLSLKYNYYNDRHQISCVVRITVLQCDKKTDLKVKTDFESQNKQNIRHSKKPISQSNCDISTKDP